MTEETIAKALADHQIFGGWDGIVTEGLREMYCEQARAVLAAHVNPVTTAQVYKAGDYIREHWADRFGVRGITVGEIRTFLETVMGFK